MKKMRKFTLKNGLTVIHQPTDSKVSGINVLVKSGSADETKNFGVAHFIEHMVFNGTKKRNALEIATAIEGIGGETGAYTANGRTCFYVKTLTKHLDKSMEVVSDIIINPTFTKEQTDKERQIILSEINFRHDEPRYHQWDLFMQTMFPKLPIGREGIGTVESVTNMTPEDLKEFHKEHYVPNNIILSIVGGDKTQAQIKAIAEKHFGDMTPSKVPKKQIYKISNKTRSKKNKRDIKQSYVMFGNQTPGLKHKDAAVLEVTRAVLAKGFSGKYFDEIRNKRGLAYDVGAYYHSGNSYGFFVSYVSTEAKNISKCQKIMQEQIDKAHLISDKELRETKNFLEGEMVFENQDPQKTADSLAFFESAGKLELFKTQLKDMKKVTQKDIKRVTAKYLKKDFTKIVIGK